MSDLLEILISFIRPSSFVALLLQPTMTGGAAAAGEDPEDLTFSKRHGITGNTGMLLLLLSSTKDEDGRAIQGEE